MNTPPDIVMFMMDQLSAKWVESALGGVADLPNLQRLIRNGVCFDRAFTSNPVCCAARASLATGLSSRGHGVLENGYALDPSVPTFMHALRRAGYRTGLFGKAHFTPHHAGFWPDLRPYGLDVWHVTEDGRGGEWLDWVRDNHPEHYDAALATVWSPYLPEFSAYGPDRIDLRPRIAEARDRMTWASSDLPGGYNSAYALPFPAQVSQTEWITMHAEAFIEQTPGEQPIFAQVSYVQPHIPYCAPAEHLQRVNPARLPTPLPAEWTTDPHAPRYFEGMSPARTDWRTDRHAYFADLTHLDDQLGRIEATIQRRGRADQTVIVVLSDHGDLLHDHGLTGKEERHYDACVRIPMVWSGPGFERATRGEMVQLEDVCPTLLALAGASLPSMPVAGPYLKVDADSLPTTFGRSLVPMLRGESADGWREDVYIGSYNPIWSARIGDWARTIRSRRHRYTLYPGMGEQLFDLETDPDEQRNLAGNAGASAIRSRMRDRLLESEIAQEYPKPRRQLYQLGVH